jgi:hypothetical protein
MTQALATSQGAELTPPDAEPTTGIEPATCGLQILREPSSRVLFRPLAVRFVHGWSARVQSGVAQCPRDWATDWDTT